MSGFIVAGVGVLPVAGVAIAGAVVIGAAAGAVMTVRAGVLLGAEIGSQWRAISAQERAERLARAAADEAVADWQRGVLAVLERNSAIEMLAATAGRHGYGLPLPATLRVSTESTAQLREWCTRTDAQLKEAESLLAGHLAGSTALRLRQALGLGPAPAGGPPTLTGLAELLAKRPAPQRPRTGSAQPVPSGVTLRSLAQDAVRVLGRLSPYASEPELARVAEVGARIRECVSVADAQDQVEELRLRVQEINAAARSRRADGLAAAELRQALADWASPGAQRLHRALAEVMTGTAALTDELHADALAEIRLADASDRQRYLADTLTATLTELGYQVGAGFQTLTVDEDVVQVTRDGWPDHSVRMVVDHRAKQLRAAMVRTRSAAGDEQRSIDVEREQQWCDSFVRIQQRLAEGGVLLDPQRVIAPAEYQLSVVPAVAAEPIATTAPTATPAAQRRDRRA